MHDFTLNELNSWKHNPLINPKTNRTIKENGPTFNILKNAYDNMQKGGTPKSYQVGLASYLPKNEDRYVLQQNNGFLWASVFDGHGGKDVSTFLRNNVVKVFKKVSESSQSMEHSLEKTYDILEKAIKQNNLKGGSTGSTLLVDPRSQKIYIAHVGDSRIIAKKNKKVIALTDDHKPNKIDEYKRIRAAGDSIIHSGVWRVGSLAVSRVFGDTQVKNNHAGVIATPNIINMPIKGFSCILLGTDGLFDVCTNEEIIAFVETRNGKQLNDIAKELVFYAKNKGSMDDITAIIIRL